VLTPILLTLPWVAVMGFLALVVRLPRPLPGVGAGWEGGSSAGSAPPRVSIVVPARNEAENVERVLRSLADSDWPDLEIVLVDDRSEDETARIARRVAAELGGARAAAADGVGAGPDPDPGSPLGPILRVLDGAPLPEGWLGKPWACMQGAREATGELILFTDADTRHAPELLGRAVIERRASGADALTLAGRQLMESFWERVVQPQIFTAMLLRYWDQRDPLPRARWRSAIANGQYILFRREAYEAIGGHEAVRGEVVEDLKLAQHLVRSGHLLAIRRAEDAFSTRMYTSLGEIVRGWSKNVILGGLATIPPGWLRRVAPLFMVFGGAFIWLLPATVLGVGALTGAPAAVLLWSGIVVGLTVLFWGAVSARMAISPAHGLVYPLGAAVTSYIFLRAWIRGGRVEWKGRRYRVRGASVAGEPGGLD